MAHKGLRIAGVGKVTAAFSGDVNFLAQFFVALQQRYPGPAARGKQRGHQTGRASTNNQH